MTDVFEQKKCSGIVLKVKSKGNKSTELRSIGVFKQNSITGWRRNHLVKDFPDFAFQKRKIAVFVDACVSHGHDCRDTRPANYQEYLQRSIIKIFSTTMM